MHKNEYKIKTFSSARSGRVTKVILPPPFLIYALFGLSILFQIPAGYVIHHLSFTLGMLLNQLGTILIPTLLVIRFFGLSWKAILPFKKVKVHHVLISVIMMCSLAVVTDYLIYATEWALPVSKSLDDVYSKLMHVDGFGSYVHKLFLLCILPGVCEEIFFRGFCQVGLSRYYGTNGGIVITAAIFAIAHLSPWYTPLYFMLGLFLSWLFATSGSLWIPIICHVINNLWTFTMHAMNWNLPIKGNLAWINGIVLVATLAILALTVYAWKKGVRKGIGGVGKG